MNRTYAHINTAVHLIEHYKGDMPLRHYLQHYFSQNKKHGSKDRKSITHLCYSYYRLGHALKELPVEERLKVAIAAPSVVFPWKHLLSKDIDAEAFEQSFLQQPDLFLRIRPGKEKIVRQKLEEANILFHVYTDKCIALSNTSKADSILEINREAVVQDLSSQRVGAFMEDIKPVSIWDCCAASGGKSIMAYDILSNIELTVSDIRPSIIKNLKERFKEAGINKYQSFIADLTNSAFQLSSDKYDLIIADVPCSSSGTWARTPEQLYFFAPDKIDHYRKLQEDIVKNVIPALKPGGILLYITCSVFKKENEEMVDFIKTNFGLSLDKMELLKGYDEKADSMFAARFIN